jgi:hypothetical protein
MQGHKPLGFIYATNQVSGELLDEYSALNKECHCAFWEPTYAILNPKIAPIIVELSSFSIKLPRSIIALPSKEGIK